MKKYYKEYILIATIAFFGVRTVYTNQFHLWAASVPYPRLFGSILIGFSIIAALYLVHSSRTPKNNIATYICTKCRQSIHYTQAKEKCPTCGVELEPLDGFYNRHPELKDK